MSQSDLWSAAAEVLRTQALGPPLESVPRSSEVPLSFAQERIWRLQRAEPDSPCYNVPLAWHIKGPLEVEALKKALNALVERHEALRTVFPGSAGVPAAYVVEPRAVPFSYSIAGPGNVQRLVAENAGRPFVLADGPLLRADLYRLCEDRHLFVVTVHQIAFDGWSMRVLCRELAAFYRAFRDGVDPLLGALRLQYPDFAYWQRQLLRGEALQREVSYWRKKLDKPYSPLALPTDHPRPLADTGPAARQEWAFGKELTQALARLGAEHGATLFAVLVASLQALMHRYTAQDDIIVFASMADRANPDLKRLIGLVANVVPLRADLSGKPAFRHLLWQVRDVAVGAFAHQGLPLERIVELLDQRGGCGAPLFQVMFIYQNTPMAELELDGLISEPAAGIDNPAAKLDLQFEAVHGARGLRGSLKYRADLYTAATIARLLSDWQTLLTTVVSNPATTIAGGCAERTLAPGCARGGTVVEPRDGLEMQIAELCRQAFGIKRLGVTDNFLALGGNSLSAARMLARIGNVTGIAVALADLLQAPSVAELATVLRSRGWVARLSLITPVRACGRRPPFFWLRGEEGGPAFERLRESISDAQPLYEIAGTGQAMKAAFEIREIQRRGPYYLGAGSNDVTAAYEIASRLALAGENVALLLVAGPCRDKTVRRSLFSRWRQRLAAPEIPRAVQGIEVLEVAGSPGDPASIALRVADCLQRTQIQQEGALSDEHP